MICLYGSWKKLERVCKNDLLKGTHQYNRVRNKECSQGGHNGDPGFIKNFLSLKIISKDRKLQTLRLIGNEACERKRALTIY